MQTNIGLGGLTLLNRLNTIGVESVSGLSGFEQAGALGLAPKAANAGSELLIDALV